MYTNVIHERIRIENVQIGETCLRLLNYIHVGKEIGAVFAELFGGLNRVHRYLTILSLEKRDDLLHGRVLITGTGVMEEFCALPDIPVFVEVHGPLTSSNLSRISERFQGMKIN